MEQAVAFPPHLLFAQAQPRTLPHSCKVVTVAHFVAVPEHELVGVQPLATEHCCSVSDEHAVAAPLHTGAPPEPPPALEPEAPAVDMPPEPARLVVPPVPTAPPVPPTEEAPASPATLALPLELSGAPASPPELEPALSFETPAAPAASLFEAAASPALPDEPMSVLDPPQLMLSETAHGTNHSQEDLFMPHGWPQALSFYYPTRS